ncbi:MAG: ferrous iron transport protein B [Luteitalea sp.]|nr:ferrous iron transport protein B [Luteitalea sp.]
MPTAVNPVPARNESDGGMAPPAAVALSPEPARVAVTNARVALIGNPNTGKTTLFNRLCGARAKTANFPGTTTGARVGRRQQDSDRFEIVDLPGLYQLSLDVPEARVCRAVLKGEGSYRQPDAVVVVVDACNLSRNLVLVGELLSDGVPVVVALNMVDLAQRRGLSLDAGRLAAMLGCPVVPMVARRGSGIDALLDALKRVVTEADTPEPTAVSPRPIRAAVQTATALDSSKIARVMPSWAPVPRNGSVEALAAWADDVAMESVGGTDAVGSDTDTLTERLDKALTHPVAGMLVFLAVMGGLFWILFALATVPMDLIGGTFAYLGELVGRYLPPGPVHDLLAEGIIGGIAGTVVFLPQICLLFFLISLLEDTGYLARAAFVMDRVLSRFGLPGHAFVPLLTSHACAIPGIMAARLIPDRRDRLATIFIAPFMSCSARLPVYVLLTSLLFAERPALAGLAFAGCYLLGGTAAMGSALLARGTLLKGRARPMVLELPSYKVPSLLNALVSAKDQGVAFLKTAGTVIVAICIVMWWLSAYPAVDPPAEAVALRAQAAQPGVSGEQAAALSQEADFLTARAEQAGSFAGQMGQFVQPVFAPLGYDWQLTVGVLTSFLAREVFVSTMSVLVGGSPDMDVEDQGVIARIRTAPRADGRPVFTPATSVSVLLFFVLAMQCLPTLAVTRRETGSLKWAGLQLGYMSGLAYVTALVAYQSLRLLGIS